MYSLLFTLATWFQPEASSGSAPAAGAKPAGGGGAVDTGLANFGMIALMMVVFYLVAIRPQQKKQKELDRLLKALAKGQKVRTSSGIRGEIVDFKTEQGDEVVLLIADKVKVNVLRSHIASVIDRTEEKKQAETEKKS